jgi:hypothetical protein
LNFLILTIALTGLTSVLAYAATRGKSTVQTAFLREGISDLLEWIGAFGFFLMANLLLGLILIIMVRSATRYFISAYDLDTTTLLIFSAAQGFVFQLWWKRK